MYFAIIEIRKCKKEIRSFWIETNIEINYKIKNVKIPFYSTRKIQFKNYSHFRDFDRAEIMIYYTDIMFYYYFNYFEFMRRLKIKNDKKKKIK